MSMRLKRMFALGFSLFLAVTAYAETCPSIENIKQDNLYGWKVYKNTMRTPATPEQVKEFKDEASQFLEASWLA